jgi:hypothetical protein
MRAPGLVAKNGTRRVLPAADEEYLRDSTGGQTACVLVNMNGGALIPPYQQREDDFH